MIRTTNEDELGFSPEQFLAESGAGRTITTFDKDQAVFAQGDPANSIYYIQKGKVQLRVVSKSGKEAVIALLASGDFFGEGCLAGQEARSATAIAMTDCSITRLERVIVVDALQREPAFSALLLTYMLTRTKRIEEDLVDQLFNSSEKRLARALLLLADFGKEGKPKQEIASISQETLAKMIGATRSRVSFFMNNFRKLGYIKYGAETIEVHSSLLNVVLHD